jgi:hypothetical protein
MMLRPIAIFSVIIGLAIAVSSCKKEDDPVEVPDPFAVSFEVNGVEYVYEDGENNYGNGPGIDTYLDSAGTLHSQFTTFIRSSFDPDYENDILTIQIVKFFNDTLPVSYGTSFSMFDEGIYNYGSWNSDTSYLGIDGAVITYTDGVGKTWSSDQLYGSQANWADFEVSKHAAVDHPLFGAETVGTFECLVFDGLGDQLEIRNGSFKARTIYQTE